MVYNPFQEKAAQALAYFGERKEQFGGFIPLAESYASNPTLDTAVSMMTSYFQAHKNGDIRSLRRVTNLFADKRAVRSIVSSVLADERALKSIAAISYPHPIGFSKLVLHHHKPQENTDEKEYKLRLHIYWNTPQEIGTELTHLHRFEMASSPITGEITNHEFAVREFHPEGEWEMATEPGLSKNPKEFTAYTGYFRDKDGVLHKNRMGKAILDLTNSLTFVPGQSYAQNLET
ncbi:hypothetical protein HY837_03290, partial [archaeon]|nr:hypothetical protein [archaeon]